MHNTVEELQKKLCDYIIKQDKNVCQAISSDDSQERCSIYKEAVSYNLVKAVSITFPGIWALLGEECANAVAYKFIKQPENLPATGCLDDWGGQFPLFLKNVQELKSVPYLSDYAKYEWLYHKCFKAADSEAVSNSSLIEQLQDEHQPILIEYLPSVQIFDVKYPIHLIRNIIDNQEETCVHIDADGYYYSIYRTNSSIVLEKISSSLCFFLSLLQLHTSLQSAAEQAAILFPDFNLINALQFIVSREMVFKISKGDHRHDG